MAADFATVQVSGRVTSDPKSFDVGDNGAKKVVFGVAVNRYFKQKDSDEFNKKTTFIDCVAWGRTGDHVAQFAKKGVKVAITGNLEEDRFTNKDNAEVRRMQINVENISIFSVNQDSPTDEPVVTTPSARKSTRKTSENVQF